MANVGYIPLYRKLRDNFLWKEKRPRTKVEAWIDILMEVQHDTEPQEVVFGMTVLKCHYAQSLKSIKTWAKRWRWSKDKVYRFFRMLEKCGMIAMKTERVTTRITVCNYGKYDPRQNSSKSSNKTQAERCPNASRTRPDTDNNVNNEKNEKNGKKNPAFNFSSYKTFYEMDCEKADAAFEEASRKFLADGAE